jgi:hypothetical protein
LTCACMGDMNILTASKGLLADFITHGSREH